MTSFSLCYVALLVTCNLCMTAAVHAWGSEVVERPPDITFAESFSTNAQVTVSKGSSYASAEKECDETVGASAFCHIRIDGLPSELQKKKNQDGIEIKRSRTMLSSANGVQLTRSGKGAFVSVFSKVQQVVIDGLEIRGLSASELYGIQVFGSGIAQVVIRNCEIYDLAASQGAHGIAVYGEKKSGVMDVSISNNHVHDMKTGWSESIVVNGYVRKWAISNNRVERVNNIAIDAIGGEGTFKPAKKKGRTLPHPNDVAMDGVIEGNVVSDMSTVSNKKYGSKHSWAAAIYVDGGKNIIIRGNTVTSAEWGFEIGAENCVITENIKMSGNKASDSYFGDLVVGGYSKFGFLEKKKIGCNPLKTNDNKEGHGYVQRVTVDASNTFQSTGAGKPNFEETIHVMKRTTFAVIEQPGVSEVNQDGDGSAKGDENAIRTS